MPGLLLVMPDLSSRTLFRDVGKKASSYNRLKILTRFPSKIASRLW